MLKPKTPTKKTDKENDKSVENTGVQLGTYIFEPRTKAELSKFTRTSIYKDDLPVQNFIEPTLDWGTVRGGNLYHYPDNGENATYHKDSYGNWYKNADGGAYKWQLINDPNGQRTKLLNEKAVRFNYFADGGEMGDGTDPTGYGSMFGQNPMTYLERRQMMRGQLSPNFQLPPQIGGIEGSNNSTQANPTSLEEVDDLYKNGQISREQADQYELTLSNQGLNQNTTPLDSNITSNQNRNSSFFPPINLSGSDLSTELNSLGRFIGSEPGTKGRGLGIVGAAGAAVLDIAGSVASGIGLERRNQYMRDWEREQRQNVQYSPVSQTANTNNLGGNSFKFGGLFEDDGLDMFPNGGSKGGPLNPYYSQQMKLYNQWGDASKFIEDTDKVLQGPELDAWYEQQIKNNPDSLKSGEFIGGFKPEKVYISKSGNAYYPTYSKPSRYLPPTNNSITPSSNSTPAPASAPSNNGVFLSANTGQPLPDRGSSGQVNRQYGQFLDEFASSPEQVAKSRDQQAIMDENRRLIGTMTEQQLADMRSKKLTPLEYLGQTGTTPTFKFGGLFEDKVPGQIITFKYGGKKVTGPIDRIENGKIYLK